MAYREGSVPTGVIVQVTRQSQTGLAKDQFENVFHFLDVTSATALQVAATAFDKLWDFFMADGPTGTDNIATWLSHCDGQTIRMKAYDTAAAKPRPIIAEASFTYPTPGSIDLPAEVALCLSYYTDRNAPSKRGRLYIGPLNIGALNGLTNDPVRPKPACMLSFIDAGHRMVPLGLPAAGTYVADSTAGVARLTTVSWALASVKLGTYAAVLHGWVDDEWDGQSRRRVEAANRSTF